MEKTSVIRPDSTSPGAYLISSLCTMSWSSVTSGKWPSWSVSKCSRSWRHRSQKPRVRPCEPLCGLLRGGAASLALERDSEPLSGGFLWTSPALRRTKEEAGERHWRFSAPTPFAAARSADCHEGLRRFEIDADYRAPNVLWRYSL